MSAKKATLARLLFDIFYRRARNAADKNVSFFHPATFSGDRIRAGRQSNVPGHMHTYIMWNNLDRALPFHSARCKQLFAASRSRRRRRCCSVADAALILICSVFRVAAVVCSAGTSSRALQRRFGFTAHLRRLRAAPIGDRIQLHRRRPAGAWPLWRRRSSCSAIVVAERRRHFTADRGQGQCRAMRCPRRLSGSADRPFHRGARYLQSVHGQVWRSAVYVGTVVNEHLYAVQNVS